jgi:putative transposase
MKNSKPLYHGHRFPAVVISYAVRWYFRFQLSLRDIEELLFERGIVVSYETVRRWCDKFGTGFAHRVKAARRKPGSTWHLDELCVMLRGEPYVLWWAVDEHGAELDILLQKRRDTAAAERFFKRVLRSCPVPRKIVTDQLRSYPAAKSRIPELANVKHVFVKAAPRANNRPKIAINLRVNVRGAFEGFGTPSAPRRFSRTSDRSGSTLRSSDICSARLSTANNSLDVLTRGIVSPGLPKIRPPSEESSIHRTSAPRSL